MSLESFWDAQAEWSQATFGTDVQRGPTGPLRHLACEVLTELLGVPREEVDKVLEFTQQASTEPEEYVDLQFLVFDAARRAGISYWQLVAGCHAKLAKNKVREWPPFNPDNINEAVEHVRTPQEEVLRAATGPQESVRQFRYDGGREVEIAGTAAFSNLNDTPGAPAPEAKISFEGKVCEVCGATATRATHDLMPDGKSQVTHWLCSKHARKANVIGDFS